MTSDTTPQLLPEESLLPWAEQIIGPFRVRSRFAHDHGYSQLWRLEAERPVSPSGSPFCWLKCHQYPGKWAGEVYALTEWTARLGLSAPRVLGRRAETPAVLLTEIPGSPQDSVTLERQAEESLWRAAGEYLARLHTKENHWFGAVNVDGTPQGMPHGDPVAFTVHGIESRLIAGRDDGIFDRAEQEFIVRAASDWTAALAGEMPRAIHRDFSPRNWMTGADGAGTLTGVIDFEHARWDLRAADLSRGCDTDFVNKPHLEDAFLGGYLGGGAPDESLRAQIRAQRLLQAVAGIVFAVRVGDAPFEQINREALHRLMTLR
jgi:hypothetical protein